MVSITLDTIIKGGQVVTKEGVQKLSILKTVKFVLGPTERSNWARQVIATGKYVLPLVDRKPSRHTSARKR
jgi:hypothetical protein